MIRRGFSDGATFVSLTPVTDSRQALDGLARAFRMSSEEEREPLTERLLESLRSMHLLLLLDNLEHLAGIGPYLSRLLDAAPNPGYDAIDDLHQVGVVLERVTGVL